MPSTNQTLQIISYENQIIVKKEETKKTSFRSGGCFETLLNCMLNVSFSVLKSVCLLKNDPPFFITDLPKTLLFHSRICMSFAC